MANRPHLRLVYDAAALPSFEEVRHFQPHQLELPLDRPHLAVVLDVHDVRSSLFREALLEIRPQIIFDVRRKPRFDILAGNRAHAFSYFREIGSKYIDVFGALSEPRYERSKHNPRLWGKVFSSQTEKYSISEGPFLALLDDENLINSMSKYLAASLSSATNKPISLCRYYFPEDAHFSAGRLDSF